MTDIVDESSQKHLSEKAAKMKAEPGSSKRPDVEEHADEGLNPQPRPDYPPSGAFDAEGHRPVLERSRKVR